jgi:imidazole glycerol-phosphate synthase subunit HisH
MKVVIVDYGMGNLGSVRRAFDDLGASVTLAKHPASLFDADRIVLPGVGAFGEGMLRLQRGGFVEALHRRVRDDGCPLLGICLGMQMLAAAGEEGGVHHGLDLVGGRVRRLDSLGCSLRVPHVGWNEVAFDADDPLFATVAQHSDFYFVHSFAFEPGSTDAITARTDYGVPVIAGVRRGHVFGTQFHPEKSSKAGRRLLQNFLNYRPC